MSDDKQRQDVVVVTGASGGVGRAVAHAFAKRGARVGLLARGEPALERGGREVRTLGGEALVVPTDVGRCRPGGGSGRRCRRALWPDRHLGQRRNGHRFARVVDTDPAEFRRATEVTYLGTVHGTMAALKRMTARDSGKIVQVGSALSYRAIPLQAAYCGAKFAIRGFTDSIRTELRHDRSHVQITMVQMPGLNTTQFNWCRSKLPNHPQPVPPIYQPEIAAEAVYWAAHHRRRELWVGYSSVEAIIGNKLAPGLADRYLAAKAFSGQQVSGMPVSADRPDNLFEPRPELAATHGIFDQQAKDRSPQVWAATHRREILAAAAAAVAAGTVAALAR